MTGTMKNKPAACCCDTVCEIDSFTAETAFTSDAIRTAEHPQSPYPTWLQAEVKAAIGDTLKMFLVWDEATPGDGLYVEFTSQDGATNGTLKLYRKDGTQLGSTLNLLCADETYWNLITACYDPDTQEFTACFDARDSRGYVVRGQCVSATVPSGFAAGRKAGYGGTGSIKNYKYDRLWYCEPLTASPTVTRLVAGSYPSANETQLLDLGSVAAGHVIIGHPGNPFGQINYNSTAFDVENVIASYAVVGLGNVAVTGDAGGPFTIEFIGGAAQYGFELIQILENALVTDCHALGDAWDYAYDPLPPRTVCHKCGSPSCTVVSETFSGIAGDVGTPGDMPCGWDAAATNWGVVDGAATGDGAVCHEYDTTGGSYNVSATFALGHLETQGDSVTVAVTHGATTHSVTFTRVAGLSPGDPDKYSYSFLPAGFPSQCVAELPASITLNICPTTVHNSLSSVWVDVTVVPSQACVEITQPTLAGHEDASLTAFSIIKNNAMDDDCPTCDPDPTCAIWSGGFEYPDCDWTLDSGDWPIAGLFATSGTQITSTHVVDAADATETLLTWMLPTDWGDSLEIGDEIVFTFGPYTLTIVYVSDLVGGVHLYEATLAPATGADTFAEFTSMASVTFCVEIGTNPGEWVVIANFGNTRLLGISTTAPGGSWGVTVTYTGGGSGFTVLSAGASKTGPVQTDSGRIICPGCYLTCTSCIDSYWPSGMIADIQGLETLASASWLDCSDQSGPFYLGPNIYSNCVSTSVYWFGPVNGMSIEYRVTVMIAPSTQALWAPIGLSGSLSYQPKTGLVITSGYYLKVMAMMRPWIIGPPTGGAPYVWAQLWLKKLSPIPYACSAFNEEVVPWAGSFFYYGGSPPSFFAGCGGVAGGAESSSIVKVTAA